MCPCSFQVFPYASPGQTQSYLVSSTELHVAPSDLCLGSVSCVLGSFSTMNFHRDILCAVSKCKCEDVVPKPLFYSELVLLQRM